MPGWDRGILSLINLRIFRTTLYRSPSVPFSSKAGRISVPARPRSDNLRIHRDEPGTSIATQTQETRTHAPISRVSNDSRPEVCGKFLRLKGERFWIKSVTYGSFRPNEEGDRKS